MPENKIKTKMIPINDELYCRLKEIKLKYKFDSFDKVIQVTLDGFELSCKLLAMDLLQRML